MKCRFELTYLYDLLTYLKTIRANVDMLGIIDQTEAYTVGLHWPTFMTNWPT
jgi:hypothetical protein